MTDNKELFAKEHDKLFADLKALNEQQIEVEGSQRPAFILLKRYNDNSVTAAAST
jgi:hypothetical protein